MSSDSFILKKYQPILSMFSGDNPLTLLDESYHCLYSSDGLFEVDSNIMGSVFGILSAPISSVTEVPVYKGGTFYCMRLYPLKGLCGEDLYVGEIISRDSVMSMLGCMDASSKLLPLYNAVEMKVAEIWTSLTRVHAELLKADNLGSISDLLSAEKAVCYISSACINAYEFVNMQSREQSRAVIDAVYLCEKCIKRCNYALAKCGRRVSCFADSAELYIYADCHRAIVAVVNAVQNALLYSPRDTEPVVLIYSLHKGQRDYVEICVRNENIMFSKSEFCDEVDYNFNYQRLGYGIPIIKAFVKNSGGSFSMSEEEGTVSVKITLPAAHVNPGVCVLRTSSSVDYQAEIPNFIDVMMSEVAVFFGAD